jgi:hypothetical protein
MFVHSTTIPVDQARAIWRIAHGQCEMADFEFLDQFQNTLKNVKSIFEANGMDFSFEERRWWAEQFPKMEF